MTVTMAIRYAVADVKVATDNTKKARAMYMKAGAKAFRVHQFFTGVFNGEHCSVTKATAGRTVRRSRT